MVHPTSQLRRKLGIISLRLGFVPFLLVIIGLIGDSSGPPAAWLLMIVLGLLPLGISRFAWKLKPPPVTINEKTSDLDTVVVLILLAVGLLALFLLGMLFRGVSIG